MINLYYDEDEFMRIAQELDYPHARIISKKSAAGSYWVALELKERTLFEVAVSGYYKFSFVLPEEWAGRITKDGLFYRYFSYVVYYDQVDSTEDIINILKEVFTALRENRVQYDNAIYCGKDKGTTIDGCPYYSIIRSIARTLKESPSCYEEGIKSESTWAHEVEPMLDEIRTVGRKCDAAKVKSND